MVVVQAAQSRGRAVGMGLIWGTEGRSGVCHTVSVEERCELNGVALFVGHETRYTADCRAECLLGVVLINIH